MKFEQFDFSRFVRMFLVALFVTIVFTFLPTSQKEKKRKTSEVYQETTFDEVPLSSRPSFNYNV